MCTVPFSLCTVLLWGLFWGTCRCPKCSQVGLLQILSYLLSNPTRIFEFGAHLPLQIFILPRLLPVCQNRGKKVIFFGCFWPPKDSDLAQISCPSTSSRDFPLWIQKCKPFFIWSSRFLALRQNPVFCLKIYHVTKNSPNFLKFGLEVLYGVLWCAKEVLSKIRSWSFSFASFSFLVSLFTY